MRTTLGLVSLAFALLCTLSALAVAPPSAAPAGDFLTAEVLAVDAPAPATCDVQLVGSQTVASQTAASSPVPMGFEEALFGSCNSNQCYLACIQKGYWAGYCISGTCVCQSNPGF